MPGPLPKPQRRRRNTPTVPSTRLPAGGRKGRPPRPPESYALGEAGRAWWRWAWATPQATAWDRGALYTAARRAQLEDEHAALDLLEDRLELKDLLAGAEPEAIVRVEFALGTLKRAATGSVSLKKEMRELDRRLGLDPKALAELRWTIVADDADAEEEKPKTASARGRLRAV